MDILNFRQLQIYLPFIPICTLSISDNKYLLKNIYKMLRNSFLLTTDQPLPYFKISHFNDGPVFGFL